MFPRVGLPAVAEVRAAADADRFVQVEDHYAVVVDLGCEKPELYGLDRWKPPNDIIRQGERYVCDRRSRKIGI